MLNYEHEFVQDSYNKISKEFKCTRVFTWKWTDEFINNLQTNCCVLDIGSGTGRNLIYKNINIIGIDISIEQLKNSNGENINGDMISLPFRNDIFNNIISIASFHHLSTIKRRQIALSEMKRVLKKNGTILMSVWSFIQPKKTRRHFEKYGDTIVKWREIPRYYYIFEINELKKLLNEYFTIINYSWDCGNEIFILKNNL